MNCENTKEIIYPGTTPTQTFETDIDLAPAVSLEVTYEQDDVVVITKTLGDVTFGDMEFYFELAQEETLLLKSGVDVFMQIRARYPNGQAVESNVMVAGVGEILGNGGVI